VTPNIAFANVGSDVAQFLFEFVLSFLGFFVGWAANFLNFAVNEFIIDFGGNVTGTGIGAAIDTLWSVVRDFFNIIFIFAIIYLGFKMILGSDDSGTKRALVYLIIAALLVNFSLFISKFIVDFSNILAEQVAISAFPAALINGNPVNGTVDIGTNFFRIMGIPGTLNASQTIINSEGAEWGYIFGLAMVYTIAIFAFASGALLLVIRYAVLCIFMVLSPFMFIGWILPQYKSVMNRYWGGFLGRAFFAPAYILLLYFSGAVIQASFSTQNQSSIGQALSSGGANGTSITNNDLAMAFAPFILSAVFLIASVQIASKLSADGAGTMLKVGGNIARGGRRRLQNGAIWTGRKVGEGATYVPRAGARSAANYGGNKLNQYLDQKQRSGSKIANNWFVDEKVRGAASGLKATKAGFDNTIDERDKKQSKLDSSKEAWTDIDAGLEAAQAKYTTPDPNKIYDPSTGNIVFRDVLKAADPALLQAAEKAEGERETKKAKMLGRQRDISPAELEQLYQNDKATFEKLVPHLDDGKAEKLLTSETLNSAQIKDIYGMREAALKESVKENGVTLASEFSKLSIKQIELLGDEFIRDNAEMFTQDQWEAIKKSEKFTETQKESYKAAKKNRIKSVLASSGKNAEVDSLIYDSSGSIKNQISGEFEKRIIPTKFKKPKEIATLPYDALVDERLIGEIPVDAVKQIGRDNAAGKSHLSAEQIDDLYDEFMSKGSSSVVSYMLTSRAQRDFLDQVDKI